MTFVPDLPVLLAFTAAALILFLTPGPDMSLWLAKSLQGGRRAGLAAMAGTMAGACIHATLAAFGISVLITASPIAFAALKITGALYLLWLAWQTLRNGSTLQVEETGAPARPAPLIPAFLLGLGVNLANPKVVIFFITFLPGFVAADDPHAGGKLLFLGLHFVALSSVLGALLIVGASQVVGALRRSPRVLRWIDHAFAGVFVAFAATILRTQASR